MSKLLEINDLSVSFGRDVEEVQAVRGISFNIDRGETIALVGESGSGKSVSALSVMQLLPYPLAHHPKGSIKFNGEELIGTTDKRMRQLRGDDGRRVLWRRRGHFNQRRPRRTANNVTAFRATASPNARRSTT